MLDNRYRLTRDGHIKRTRKPNLIKITKLETSYKYFRIEEVARVVAISLCIDDVYKRGADFIKAMNCAKVKNWKNIAIIKHSSGRLHGLDFSILREEKNKDEFLNKNISLKKALITQLTIINKALL